MGKLKSSPPEPSSLIFSLPKDYTLAPKGNVYITKHCRGKTHNAGRTVFVVHDRKNQTLGIGVPKLIYEEVLMLSTESAAARAKAVDKKDAALERKTQIELVRQFPKIPKDIVPTILKHMLEKRSGRVGRTSEPLPKVVLLGVRAHIRHVYTDYEKLLKEGVEREEARNKIRKVMDDKVKEWGGGSLLAGRCSGNTSFRKGASIRKATRKMTAKLVSRPKRIGTT